MKNILIGLCLLCLLGKTDFSWAAAARNSKRKKLLLQKQAVLKKRLFEEKQKHLRLQKMSQRQKAPLDEEVRDTADASEILEFLQTSSEVWPLIIDREAKEFIVSHFLNSLQKQGVIIKKDVSHYVDMIDAMAVENPSIFSQPFKNVLKFMAIVEYDYDNGQDKDALARKILGPQGAAANKKRLGL